MLITAATVVWLLAMPAAAAPEWTPSTRLDPSNSGVAATTGTGETIAVWESGSDVKGAYRRNAGSWTPSRSVWAPRVFRTLI